MKINLQLSFMNGDSGERAEHEVDVEISDNKHITAAWVCESRPTEETFTVFLRGLYDNPNMDGSKVGVAYNALWENFSNFAFDELGWHDVSVDVVGVSIDGEETKLGKMIDIGMIDTQPFMLSLSRDGFMYCPYA
jgi:hypothetical protein